MPGSRSTCCSSWFFDSSSTCPAVGLVCANGSRPWLCRPRCLPAAPSRRGSAWDRSAASPPAGRIWKSMCGSAWRLRRAEVPEHGAGDHLHADVQRMQVDLVGAGAELVHGIAERRRFARPEAGRAVGVPMPPRLPVRARSRSRPADSGERGWSRRSPARSASGFDLGVPGRPAREASGRAVRAPGRALPGCPAARRCRCCRRRRAARCTCRARAIPDLGDHAVLHGDHRAPRLRSRWSCRRRLLRRGLSRRMRREAVG